MKTAAAQQQPHGNDTNAVTRYGKRLRTRRKRGRHRLSIIILRMNVRAALLHRQ